MPKFPGVRNAAVPDAWLGLLGGAASGAIGDAAVLCAACITPALPGVAACVGLESALAVCDDDPLPELAGAPRSVVNV